MLKKIAFIFASGFGVGTAPVASGTFGSLLGIVLFWWLLVPLPATLQILIISIVFVLGVYTSSIVEKDLGKDPSEVIIDEVVGQWIALLFIPHDRVIPQAIAFFAFRFFDITKIPPAKQFDRMTGGIGIMMDDVVAGIYANILVQILFRVLGWI